MKTAAIFLTVIALAVGALGWLDTQAYREITRAYRATAQEPLEQLRRQEQLDEARYLRCDPQRTENRARNTIDFTPEGRSCLIDALLRAATPQGTLVLVRNAVVVLDKNPEDQPVRAAALAAIGRARDTLASQKAWLFDPQAQIDRAQAASLILRMLGAPVAQPGFEQQALALDQAEYAIHLPKLYHSQQLWRLENWWPAARPV